MNNILLTFIGFTALWLVAVPTVQGQSIRATSVPSNNELLQALDAHNMELQAIRKLAVSPEKEAALAQLAEFLKQKAAARYYFNWKKFALRFSRYQQQYPGVLHRHRNQARAQMKMFGPETHWRLPAVNLKGRAVTAYELRHLARQQKSADMTLMYFYENHDPQYPDYFLRQVRDLNRAFTTGQVDNGGNAVYEVYRAGKRVHNWLFNYHAYLAGGALNEKDQLMLVRTFLQHGAQLRMRSKTFKYGNHQTKGLTALFEIATLFPEFKISKEWQQHALAGLVWHITHEINSDGFQFERSVHYHMGDIENYFRVYQLAKRNQIVLPDEFVQQLRKMFSALAHLAQPDGNLPVLQDDTDDPYSEFNDIHGAMTLGTILFEEPIFRYFAGSEIPAKIYWLLADTQLNVLQRVTPQTPVWGSVALAETGYYTMRSGWHKDDLYMTLSSGLSSEKPDHQHGDMLGLVAWANGWEILPNYQVRYKHPEYRFFKNSWVKNVALVDSFVQGRGWKPNSGKSGFGKWRRLPQTQIESWVVDDVFDYVSGKHNGFDSLNVSYGREVLFVKGKFWLVRDQFKADKAHRYQQVWQGDYRIASPKLVHKNYDNGSGLTIEQLAGNEFTLKKGTFREKQNLVFEHKGEKDFSFFTLLLPFKTEKFQDKLPDNWQVNNSKNFGVDSDAALALSSTEELFLFNASQLSFAGKSINFSGPQTVYIQKLEDSLNLRLLSAADDRVLVSGKGNEKKYLKMKINQSFRMD